MRNPGKFANSVSPRSKLQGGPTFIFAILACCFLLPFGCAKSPTQNIEVVATTSLIGNIVKAIGKDKIDVVTIIPAGMCPGHFDIKPGEVHSLARARLLLMHGFEGEILIKGLLKSIGNKNLLVERIKVEGNWMIPPKQIEAAEKIGKALEELEPDEKGSFQENLTSYKKKVSSLAQEIKDEAEKRKLREVRVVCSEMQEEFLEWLGLGIIAAMRRPSEITLKEMRKIVDMAKKERVKIVVDNLQSGPKAGLPLAQEIGAFHLVLTNFPLTTQGFSSYESSLRDNVSKLFAAVEKVCK